MNNHVLIAYTSDIETKKSLKKLKSNEKELNNLLEIKLKDNVLMNYLNAVKKIKSENIDFVDFTIKKNIKSSKENEYIYSVSKLYNELLELEISNADRKSPEVSINILHNTLSSINAKLREMYFEKKVTMESSDELMEDNLGVFHFSDNKEEINFEYHK